MAAVWDMRSIGNYTLAPYIQGSVAPLDSRQPDKRKEFKPEDPGLCQMSFHSSGVDNLNNYSAWALAQVPDERVHAQYRVTFVEITRGSRTTRQKRLYGFSSARVSPS